ncbi:hypothetical protein BGZ92_002598 [Podila epicladia]|nr:hypothetical protein BGZ92_002598 [Podila epicladia]
MDYGQHIDRPIKRAISQEFSEEGLRVNRLPPESANKVQDGEDYLKLIAGHEKDYTLRISPQDPQARAPRLVEFQFLNISSLSDTDQRNTVFADNITQEIFTAQKFSVVLVIVSAENPFSMGMGLQLSIMPNPLPHASMVIKHRAFSDIFRYRTYVPAQQGHAEDGDLVNVSDYSTFSIDMKSDKLPIVQCLIRNTLRGILQLAMTNPPNVDTSEANSERFKALVHSDRANKTILID